MNTMKINKEIRNSFYIILLVGIIFFGCSESNSGFLDPDTSDVLNKEVVFSDSLYTYQFHARIYEHLDKTYFADNGMRGGGYWSWSDLTDDSKNRWTGGAQIAHKFNMNEITDPGNGRMRNHWLNCYQGVSRVNIFLENVDNCPLSEKTKLTLKAEARLVRSWLYFHLLRLYGGVPLVGDKVFGIADKVEVPRATFEETVDYIVSECDKLVEYLPAKQTGRDYGRVTSGAALAIKARVLLFAASPLSNGSVPEAPAEVKPLLGYETYDINRWKLAAEAAKIVIDLGNYELIIDDSEPGRGFYKMQVLRVNPEFIFCLMKENNRYPEQVLLPNSRGGQVYLSPFQSVVDAFLMDNGLHTTDSNSGYDITNPYENRDPRLYYSVLFHGSKWIPRSGSTTLEPLSFIFGEAPDGLGKGTTKTGYACRKFCDENVAGSQGSGDQVFPIIRLGEIYLDYVEAMNEFNPSNKTEIEKYLILLRQRAGIKPGINNRYGLPIAYSQEEMREIIHNERRIELAFEEGHRFFDLKRWKKLEEAKNNVNFYGIKWTKNDEGVLESEPYFVETHKFDAKRQYYFPIPPREINIVGVDFLKQNPGW